MNSYIASIVKAALEEDLGSAGDITSQACIPADSRSRAKVIAKAEGRIAGLECFKEVFRQVDDKVFIRFNKSEGERVAPGDIAAELEGHTRSLLAGERTAMNFLCHLSGVATMAARLSDRIKGTRAALLDTRKTIPGLRLAQKAAVRAGGGRNHRQALSDMMLIKENHIAAAGGISAALEGAHRFNRTHNSDFKIEIEVRNLEELGEALAGKPDRIMLDNFTIENVKRAVEITGGRIPLEVSGGVTESNIRDFAQAGVDYISVGSLTLSAPALDFSMLIEGTD